MSMKYTNEDLLDRQDFIDKMITVTEIQAQNKRNACYAIDGRWGVGKSYVLEMYKERIKMIRNEESGKNKYIVFEYNCWKYDYYEEPLLAIVATMLDTLSENNGEVTEEICYQIVEGLKEVGRGLLSKGEQIIKDKTGIDVVGVVDAFHEGAEKGKKEFLNNRDFDTFINFNKTLQKLQETINMMKEEKTIIFIVDELDRCLPEYAIKILERIHHVFDGIPNMQVILSIDKEQLEQTVKKTYGEYTNVNKYLAKFIEFDLKLEEGTFNDRFDEQFNYYLNRFDYIHESITADVVEFKKTILEGVDIRKRIAIINKCALLHDIVAEEEQTYDHSIMCVEVFLELIRYFKVNVSYDKENYSTTMLFSKIGIEGKSFGLNYIRNKYKQDQNYKPYHAIIDRDYHLVRCDNLWGLILGCYRYILGYKNDEWRHSPFDKSKYCEYAKKYWELLHIIN